MRRALHIAISLMVVVLLLRPFECFAPGIPHSEMAKCCLKGKCAPSANSDTCCKNSVPVQDQLVPLKAVEHLYPPIAIVALYVPVVASRSAFLAFADPSRHPPPLIELIAPALPLLI